MSWSQWDKIIAQYTLPYILLFIATISQDLFNPCPWMFRPRIRLMGYDGTQFRAKADLPVGFPYRFNSSLFHLVDTGYPFLLDNWTSSKSMHQVLFLLTVRRQRLNLGSVGILLNFALCCWRLYTPVSMFAFTIPLLTSSRGVARWKHKRQGVWGRPGPQWVQGKALVGGPGGRSPPDENGFQSNKRPFRVHFERHFDLLLAASGMLFIHKCSGGSLWYDALFWTAVKF